MSSTFRRAVACLAAIAGLCFGAGAAQAAVPYVNIGAPSGPLNTVAIGNDLSCQVKHSSDTALEFFPSTVTPGDCGTFIAAGGTVYGPNFAAHERTATGNVTSGAYAPFTSTGQTGRTGTGTGSTPYKVVTTATAGALAVTQTDTYFSGQESYRTDVTIRNTGGAPQSITLYRAGDCYLQNSDTGYGFVGPNNAVGCSATANNTPPGRIEQFVPITGGNNFLEDEYSAVWAAIATQAPFPNACVQCANDVDNGAGISWSTTIQPGQSATYSHFTTFSPTGRAGPPPPPESADLVAARRPSCLSIPGVVRNRVARLAGGGTVTLRTRQVDNPAAPLRLALASRGRFSIAAVTYVVNGRALAVLVGGRGTSVPVTNLRLGSRNRNNVTAIVRLSTGRTVRLTQLMVILRCRTPRAACTRLRDPRLLRCTSRTPLGGRRVNVTVTRSRAETARGGPAVVTRGRYTIVVRSRTRLAPGVYAYKAVVRTNRRGERFQMIRRVTVR